MIDIICPTNRPGSLKIVDKSLKRQTYKDWNLIVCSPEDPNLTIPYKWIKDPGKKEGEYWSLYSVYNLLVKESTAPLLVSWQDNTFLMPTGLEVFWKHFVDDPMTIVSAVGDKYSDEDFVIKTWKDPRKRTDFGTYYETIPNNIEINMASFPRKSFFDVGGFDEDLNKYSSLCGLDVLIRLDVLGKYKFMLDQTLETFSLEHPRPDFWSENEPFQNGVWAEKQRQYKVNPVLNYL